MQVFGVLKQYWCPTRLDFTAFLCKQNKIKNKIKTTLKTDECLHNKTLYIHVAPLMA